MHSRTILTSNKIESIVLALRRALFAIPVLALAACTSGSTKLPAESAMFAGLPSYAVSFDGGRGQLQVGGPFAGVEFHHSRPFPSRISFYSPVANSIDLSTDYWKRDVSQPFTVVLDFGGETDSLQVKSYRYRATPSQVLFSNEAAEYEAEISYQFGESLPFMALHVSISNRTDEPKEATLQMDMAATLRTSHAYTLKDQARTRFSEDGHLFIASFDDIATDSASVFVLNGGTVPSSWGNPGATADSLVMNPHASFTYTKTLAPGETIDVVQLIGTCGVSECDEVLSQVKETWRDDVAAYERRVNDYATEGAIFSIADTMFGGTTPWAKALLQADAHYIDGRIVPMPCPAQYNFFFTHDLLLTDLGAVMFDTERVRNDLDFVLLLARGDSLLPHAYYWREDGFKTEPTNADNWNHLWLSVVTASYLKHSGDGETVARLMPMIRESLRIMLENERDGLMYASRPDWWDIGNVYGARAYITTLTIRALQSFVYVANELGVDQKLASEYGKLALQMKETLVSRLWDDEVGYLVNMLDENTVDTHIYSGSLLAAAYDIVDGDRRATLLQTARAELLDENIGIRNAMPPDFHTMGDDYRFNGLEVGAPYKYMNGGVWPQGIAWYVQALISAGEVEEAAAATRKFLTLDGIRNSPNGQPAFFEYREADPNAASYGQIDKTTFLWAGGFYLNVLYQLGGVRENPWNIALSPNTPVGFENAEYDLSIDGALARVTWSGTGDFLKRIEIDGVQMNTSVITGSASRIKLERGVPASPYLSSATARVTDVVYSEADGVLAVSVKGIASLASSFSVVSPRPLKEIRVAGVMQSDVATSSSPSEGVYVITVELTVDSDGGEISFVF